ncbi:hypothetical protein [Dysgonomonas sp. 520]|uniref:hypothetical protein n=1 Tax=Dysgonomonas sp. 520 TaxID=2302931 RepID=UPI0013D0FA12|nr:hypothetical protein [Dysgonomonas sp. 520]NDW10182.1 hypothetical protein [Dysgonomonas sp. 520]
MDEIPRIIFQIEKKESNSIIPARLVKKLSGRIGMDEIHEITYLIQNSDKGKQQIYNFIFDEDDTLVANALWVMTHFSLFENEWLYSKQNEMVDKVLATKHHTHLRLLLHLLYRQPLVNPPRVDFLDYCLDEMVAMKEAPGTTTLCMKLAYEMCRMIPELLQEYRVALDMIEPSQLPPSLKTTRKNILKAMQKGKSLQIY